MIWSLFLWPVRAGSELLIRGRDPRRGLTAMGCPAMVVTLALALIVPSGPSIVAWSPSLTLRVELGPLATSAAVLLPAVGLAVMLYAGGHEEERGLSRRTSLLPIFTAAMDLVEIAGDLLTLLIGWEFMGAISWALIGHRWRDRESMPPRVVPS